MILEFSLEKVKYKVKFFLREIARAIYEKDCKKLML